MKFAGTVVLYNPEKEILENVETYLPFIDVLYVMDNSTKKIEYVDEIKKIKKVKYISLDGNKGIAKALKDATEIAKKDGYDFLLSMDQDSKFPTEDFKYVKEYLENNDISKLGIISVNFPYSTYSSDHDNKIDVIKVRDTITSGSFLNLVNYDKIEGYNEDLFIDFVDNDICYQFIENGYDILVMPNIALNHKIGELKEVKFLWYKRKLATHSPLRYYYIYRNYNYFKKFKKGKYKEILMEKRCSRAFGARIILRRFLTEKPHFKNLKMILRGIRDGKKGILGPYQERRNKK